MFRWITVVIICQLMRFYHSTPAGQTKTNVGEVWGFSEEINAFPHGGTIRRHPISDRHMTPPRRHVNVVDGADGTIGGRRPRWLRRAPRENPLGLLHSGRRDGALLG